MSTSVEKRGKAAARQVTAVHLQGEAMRLVTLQREPDHALRLVQARSVDFANGNGERLQREIAREEAERLVGVLPANSIILRQVELNRTEGDDVTDLLRLQAEAHLPDDLPWHRRGAALLRGEAGNERALLAGWPGETPTPLKRIGNGRTRYCPDSAALLGLRRGASSELAMLYVDREIGSMALLSGDTLRSMRVRKGGGAAPDVERAIRETAALSATPNAQADNLSQAASDLHERERRLHVPAEIRAAWAGVVGDENANDENWWQQYGVALGAAARALEAPPHDTLADLRAEAIVERRSTGARIVSALGAGRAPFVAIAACLLVLALLPALRAGTRLLVLQARVGDAQALRAQQEELTARFGLYSAVTERTWPMTKLLADLAAATPPGIEVDTLTLAQGQQVQLSGFADSLDQLVTLQDNLRAGRVFADVQLPRRHIGETGKVEFALRAEVDRPWAQAEPAFDYVARSLQERLYGESDDDATAGTTAAVRRDETGGAATSGDGVPGANGSRLTDPRSAQQEQSEAPPPLTQGDIDQMTDDEVRKALIERLAARSRPYDEETKERLAQEAEMLKAERRSR